jgi:hypothetical protein
MPLSQAMAGESQTPAERRGSMMLTSPAPMFKYTVSFTEHPFSNRH